jgi:hypothetical protein
LKPSKYGLVRKIKKLFGHVYTFALLILDTISQTLNIGPRLSLNSVDLQVNDQSFSRVAVFAAYLNSDDERSEALRIVNQIREEFDRVLIINTGKTNFSDSHPNVLVISRGNFGRDLASYKLATNLLNFESTSEIFFFNDSVIWTDNSILCFLTKARESAFEVTSLTSSDQHTFHLQSYALHLKGNMVELTKPFSSIRVSNFKRLIVEAGEKSLSRYWISRNVHIGAIQNQKTLGPLLKKYVDLYPEDYAILQSQISRGVPLNPSIHFWAPLYATSGVIKKALITANPAKLKYSPTSVREIQLKVDFFSS